MYGFSLYLSVDFYLSRSTFHASLKCQWIWIKAKSGSFYVQWNEKKRCFLKLTTGRDKSEIMYSYGSQKGIKIAKLQLYSTLAIFVALVNSYERQLH